MAEAGTSGAAGVSQSTPAVYAIPTVLQVRVPGPPVAQGRPKFARRGSRVVAYDPPRSRAWKKVAAQLMAIDMRARGLAPFEGPVQLVVIAVFPRPIRQQWKGKPMPREWHTKRPDASNVLKACEDAASAAGVFGDDAQVARVICEKWIAAGGEAPSVVVEVRGLEPGQGRG